jgi:hypothetical protein
MEVFHPHFVPHARKSNYVTLIEPNYPHSAPGTKRLISIASIQIGEWNIAYKPSLIDIQNITYILGRPTKMA